jgi:hypothetical protein
MIDEIKYHTQIMKELEHQEALQYFQEAKDIIQKYTGTLAHHNNREKLLCERYDLAKLLSLYKKEVKKDV